MANTVETIMPNETEYLPNSPLSILRKHQKILPPKIKPAMRQLEMLQKNR